MLRAGVDWELQEWDLCLYDDQITPDQSDTFAQYTDALVAVQPMVNRTVSSTGRATADGVTFTGVSPGLPDGRLMGFFIKRNSDNLLLYHIDGGLDGLSPDGVRGIVTPFLGVRAAGMTVAASFIINPAMATGNAWFRP